MIKKITYAAIITAMVYGIITLIGIIMTLPGSASIAMAMLIIAAPATITVMGISVIMISEIVMEN